MKNKIPKNKFLALSSISACLLNLNIYCQKADFILPDTICTNELVNIQNLTQNGTTFYWNFCSGSLTNIPAGTNFSQTQIDLPVFSDIVKENDNYYLFVVNHSGSLIRMNFGNSLLNKAATTNLGNFDGAIPAQAEGMEVQKDGNNWVGYLIGGQKKNSRLVRLNFGSNINSKPVATNLGNIGKLAFPVDFTLANDGINWYGFTVNADNNTITQFNFGNSLNNTPTALNLGNVGSLSYPVGFYILKNGTNFYMFIANRNSNSISRIDFGNNFTNKPVGINLGNISGQLLQPRDITVINDCGQVFGFVTNESNNTITRIDFKNSITSLPSAISLGNIGTINFPHSISEIFRSGDAVNFFVPNVGSNTISRLTFSNCSSSSIPSSSVFTPPSFKYNQPGTYNVSLFVNDGLSTQNAVCKTITVVNPPSKEISSTGNYIKKGDSVLIKATETGAKYLWNNKLTSQAVFVKKPGAYFVSIEKNGCTVQSDTVVIKQKEDELTVPFTKRNNELIKTIEVTDTAQFVLNFYDYRQQDGDIISVFVNEIQILKEQLLSKIPLKVPVKLSRNIPLVEVKVIAENLGSIPPNTAMMVTTVNGKKYEAQIVSSGQKNAIIRFKLK